MRLLQQLFRVKYVSEMDFSCMRYYPRCHKPDGLWCRGVVTSNGWGYHAECRKQPPFTFEKSHCWNRRGSHHQQVGGWEGLMGRPPVSKNCSCIWGRGRRSPHSFVLLFSHTSREWSAAKEGGSNILADYFIFWFSTVKTMETGKCTKYNIM